MPRDTSACGEMAVRIFNECMLDCGGVNFARTMVQSDVAVDGMILNYASYFCPDEKRLEKLAGYILSQAKPDGGYSWNKKSVKSDPHTTICVLEGFLAYREAGFTKFLGDIESSEERAVGWLLSNGLFVHEDKNYQKLSYPYRYRYDLLRGLEYLALNKVPYDRQMEPALQWLEKKRRTYGVWNLENVYK